MNYCIVKLEGLVEALHVSPMVMDESLVMEVTKDMVVIWRGGWAKHLTVHL